MPAAERNSDAYHAFWEALRRGEPQTREFRRIAKDGARSGSRPHTILCWTGWDASPEWSNLPRMSRIRFCVPSTTDGQLDALHRSQAVIEFALDGTILAANTNFLDAVGYRLDEIQGRHHSLFVDATEQAGAEYRGFWDKLSRANLPLASSGALPRAAEKSGSRRHTTRSMTVTVYRLRSSNSQPTSPNRSYELPMRTGQLAAVNRSQAVIEFAPDATVLAANANFLTTVGYEIEDVRGRPHAMFVEPGYAQSADYAAFWDRLRGGAFASGMFQRVGKGGAHRIQASYNPIFDPTGA